MRLQLVVIHVGHRIRYYPVSAEDGGWKVDPEWRQIVIGKGVPRTFIPLDNVLSYSIEEVQNEPEIEEIPGGNFVQNTSGGYSMVRSPIGTIKVDRIL